MHVEKSERAEQRKEETEEGDQYYTSNKGRIAAENREANREAVY